MYKGSGDKRGAGWKRDNGFFVRFHPFPHPGLFLGAVTLQNQAGSFCQYCGSFFYRASIICHIPQGGELGYPAPYKEARKSSKMEHRQVNQCDAD